MVSPVKLHARADFTGWDLANAHSLGRLGADCGAVRARLVRHHAGASGFLTAGLGHGSSFGLHFSAGAVGFELGGKLRCMGFVGLGTKSSESSHISDGADTSGLVHDGFVA
jgi:hypothetical protein